MDLETLQKFIPSTGLSQFFLTSDNSKKNGF